MSEFDFKKYHSKNKAYSHYLRLYEGELNAAKELGFDVFTTKLIRLSESFNKGWKKANESIGDKIRMWWVYNADWFKGTLIFSVVVGVIFALVVGLRSWFIFLQTKDHYAYEGIAKEADAVAIDKWLWGNKVREDVPLWNNNGLAISIVECDKDATNYANCSFVFKGDSPSPQILTFKTYNMEMEPLEEISVVVPPVDTYHKMRFNPNSELHREADGDAAYWIKLLSTQNEERVYDKNYLYENGRIVGDKEGKFRIDYDNEGNIIGLSHSIISKK